MHFKVGYIHFDCRSLSFGAIASFIFWSVKKLHFWLKSWKLAMLFLTYLHENRVSHKTLGIQIALLRLLRRCTQKKIAKDLSFGANIDIQNHFAFLAVFAIFPPIFGPKLIGGKKNSSVHVFQNRFYQFFM